MCSIMAVGQSGSAQHVSYGFSYIQKACGERNFLYATFMGQKNNLEALLPTVTMWPHFEAHLIYNVYTCAPAILSQINVVYIYLHVYTPVHTVYTNVHVFVPSHMQGSMYLR